MPDRLIQDEQTLAAAVERLAGAGPLAVDTEFLWERTYYPALALLQVAARDEDDRTHAFAFDPQAVALEPVLELIADSARVKVLHAGRIDLQILNRQVGETVGPVFDTQTAASLAGFGPQIGYADLVEAIVGVRPPKGEQYGLDQAAAPARAGRLRPGRRDPPAGGSPGPAPVARASRPAGVGCRRDRFVDRPGQLPRAARRPPLHQGQGGGSLDRRGMAILRELASWRDGEARRRNLRPTFVVKDPALVHLAAKRPTTAKSLKGLRGLHPKEAQRNGKEILAAIRRGLELPEKDLPTRKRRRRGPDVRPALDLMRAYLRQRADEVAVAAEVLATTADLERLAKDGERERFPRTTRSCRGGGAS